MTTNISLFDGKVAPINGAFEPASEEEIYDIESKLKIALPDAWRKFLATYGRCMFAGEAIVESDQIDPIGIFTIFGCKGGSGNIYADFMLHLDMQQASRVPIADDMFNNRYVWDSSSKKVFFIDYANGAAPKQVAESIDEFFRKIVVISD